VPAKKNNLTCQLDNPHSPDHSLELNQAKVSGDLALNGPIIINGPTTEIKVVPLRPAAVFDVADTVLITRGEARILKEEEEAATTGAVAEITEGVQTEKVPPDLMLTTKQAHRPVNRDDQPILVADIKEEAAEEMTGHPMRPWPDHRPEWEDWLPSLSRKSKLQLQEKRLLFKPIQNSNKKLHTRPVQLHKTMLIGRNVSRFRKKMEESQLKTFVVYVTWSLMTSMSHVHY
jgi:hypothetical protein